MSYYIYKHTCPNGKVYIGITCQKPSYRWNNGDGYRSNQHFYAAILKYGWENIKHEILFDSLTKEEAEAKEIELIAQHNSADREFGYNIEFGGFANTVSQETKEKLRAINTGKRLSDETKRKLSERFKGENHPNYGIKFSDELRLKLSEAHKGKKQSEETKQKRIEALKGQKRSAETCERLSKAQSKKVIQYDDNGNTIAVYPSICEAGSAIGINERNIGAVCKGSRKHAGGFVWRYAENDSKDKRLS